MTANQKTAFSKDLANKQMVVVREFAGPLEMVWAAWTKSELLDKWWAPAPWKAETKSMDFKEGGSWLYYMVGPDGTRMWSRADYKTIVVNDYFVGQDCFCDEQGHQTPGYPSTNWKNEFRSSPAGTKVTVTLTFESTKDLEQLVEMGFEAGFTAAHSNLDKLLANEL